VAECEVRTRCATRAPDREGHRWSIEERAAGLWGFMLRTGKNRLVLIAGTCLIAGALLVGILVDILSALRFSQQAY
jgi:hypothetical protein